MASSGQKRKRDAVVADVQSISSSSSNSNTSSITTICIQSDDSTPEHQQQEHGSSSSSSLCSQSSLHNIASFHSPKTATHVNVCSWHTDQKKKPSGISSSSSRPSLLQPKSQKQQQTDHLMQQYKDLYAAIKGEFLVPANYQGHAHEWVQLDAGMCLCNLCGAQHICFQGDCPTVQMEQSEQVCSISGCVIVLSERKAEWGALDRVNLPPVYASSSARGARLANNNKKLATAKDPIAKDTNKPSNAHLRAGEDAEPLQAPGGQATTTTFSPWLAKRTSTIHDTVEMVVREILDSPKTARCLAEEATRDQARQHACLAKLIRELIVANQLQSNSMLMQRPNLLHLEAKLSWQCHKCRRILVVPSALSPSQAHLQSHNKKKQKGQAPDKKNSSSTLPLARSGDSNPKYVEGYEPHSKTKGHISMPINTHNSSSGIIPTTTTIICTSAQAMTNSSCSENKNQHDSWQEEKEEERKFEDEYTRAEVLRRVIRLCVDNICDLIQKYGWHRVDRQMQHASRGREFICSMLYLMRMGITFKNQTILQKMEILNSLLPLQVFLPTIFNIRAKSITEGENIIKLDLQHIPL